MVSKELSGIFKKTVFMHNNTMKAMRILAAAAGVLCAVSLFAQEGRPERRGGRGGRDGGFPEPVTDSVWVIQRTQEMVEKYTLTDEQAAAVRELNTKYAPQMNFTPQRMGMGGENGERPDFRSMTDEQRQEFMQKMQAQMGEMQEKMQQMQDARKEYEKELEAVLNKDQLKAYRKDRRRQEAEMQRRMQGGMGGGRPGGMGPGGFPGGGMGGPGGFPGGGPGGFGGF
jgi:hypothetical protein